VGPRGCAALESLDDGPMLPMTMLRRVIGTELLDHPHSDAQIEGASGSDHVDQERVMRSLIDLAMHLPRQTEDGQRITLASTRWRELAGLLLSSPNRPKLPI